MTRELDAILRTDFLAFARKAIQELTGETLSNDPYLEYLGSELGRFIAGDTRRLIVNLPPRHLKTYLCSICLAAWEFAHRPSARIMIVTCAEHLAQSIARGIRDILQASWFKDLFETRVASNHSAVMDFSTTSGGAVYAASLGGSITGRGADLIIVDDPHDIKDAESIEQIDVAIDRFNTALLSRLNNRKTGKVVVIAHRIHEDDLSSYLLGQAKWKHVVLPMIATESVTYSTDYGPWCRRKGDLLRPDAFDHDDLQDLMENTHNPDFELLYQQDAEGNALPAITAECFGVYSAVLLARVPMVMSIDTGTSAGARNSFSTIQIWCAVDGAYLLVHQWREQCIFNELNRGFRRLAKRYQPSAILVEATANGPALMSVMDRQYRARTHEIVPRGSKVARCRRHIDTLLAQKILLPSHAEWRKEYVFEFVAFPHGNFTDQLDATTQFLDFMASRPHLIVPPPRTFGTLSSRRQASGRGLPAEIRSWGADSPGTALRPALTASLGMIRSRQ